MLETPLPWHATIYYIDFPVIFRLVSLQRMQDAGAYITTSESMILALARGSHHPRFKELQKLIWDPAPDSGLLSHKPEQ